jgi:hypothetical protein
VNLTTAACAKQPRSHRQGPTRIDHVIHQQHWATWKRASAQRQRSVDIPSLLRAGDEIRFTQIDEAEYREQEAKLDAEHS